MSTTTYHTRLEEALPLIRERIGSAVAEAGRPEGAVRLVAVTKSHPFEAVEAALNAGLTDLGENRIDELERKVEHFGRSAATWHMIGHLQSRKASRAAAVSDVIHSVDSMRLAERLARGAEGAGEKLSVLVQVNTSGEGSKSGFPAESALEAIVTMAKLPELSINGLMTMAPFVEDEGVLRESFRRLRILSDEARERTEAVGAELSMGMTNDMEIAIQEGSTMVRIGTALFGPRNYGQGGGDT